MAISNVTSLNLTIVNPGAEAGDTTGWTNSLGGLDVTSAASPGAHSGDYYFWGGNNAVTIAFQDVDLTSEGLDTTDIDNNLWRAELKYWQNAADATDDGRVYLKFLTGSDTEMDQPHSLNEQNFTSWTENTLQMHIPSNARKARIVQHMVRDTGTPNECYFDDLSLTAVGYPNRTDCTSSVTNPGAEGSSATEGWTQTVSGWDRSDLWIGPAEGSFFWYGNTIPSSYCEMYQSFNIVEDLNLTASDIDEGKTALEIDVARGSYAGSDASRLHLVFTMSDGTVVSTETENEVVTFPELEWQRRNFNVTIPSSARAVDLYMRSILNAGSDADGYFDDYRLYTYVTQDSGPIIKTLVDTLVISDGNEQADRLPRTVLETLEVGELSNSLKTIYRLMQDGIIPNDAQTVERILIRPMLETLVVDDTLEAIITGSGYFLVTLIDTLEIGDAQSIIHAIFARLFDSIDVSDFKESIKRLVRNIRDGVSLDDRQAEFRELFRGLADQVEVNDHQSVFRDLFRLFSDQILVDDRQSVFRDLFRVFSDQVSLSDEQLEFYILTRIIADQIVVQDSLDKRVEVLTRLLKEALKLEDSQTTETTVYVFKFLTALVTFLQTRNIDHSVSIESVPQRFKSRNIETSLEIRRSSTDLKMRGKTDVEDDY